MVHDCLMIRFLKIGNFVCGLHCESISLINSPIMQKEYQNFSLPLAVSIVLSGQYEDDVDNAEEVVYTGQGGNDLLGNKRQIKDQVMCRGNLALKVCNMEYRLHSSIFSNLMTWVIIVLMEIWNLFFRCLKMLFCLLK